MRLLERVGLVEHARDIPGELSGGQQQRVAIARALAMDPIAMLFDEPTSALDPEMINEVLDVMVALATEGMTMMVVTHEMGFARKVANRVVFMDQGEIVEDAPTAEFFGKPRSERAQVFLSKIQGRKNEGGPRGRARPTGAPPHPAGNATPDRGDPSGARAAEPEKPQARGDPRGAGGGAGGKPPRLRAPAPRRPRYRPAPRMTW